MAISLLCASAASASAGFHVSGPAGPKRWLPQARGWARAALTRPGEMPPVLSELIPTATPISSVPMPSVTTIEGTWATTTKNALTNPTARPTPRATAIVGPIGQLCRTFSQPISTSEIPVTEETETSNSPAIRVGMSASDTTTSTAWEPAMVSRFPKVKKVAGRRIEKTIVMRSQTTRIPYRRRRPVGSNLTRPRAAPEAALPPSSACSTVCSANLQAPLPTWPGRKLINWTNL